MREACEPLIRCSYIAENIIYTLVSEWIALTQGALQQEKTLN